ncbi:MAG: tagaturonate epimerase family protein [Anaerolineae bacterium]
MPSIIELLRAAGLHPPLSSEEAAGLATQLSGAADLVVYPRSITAVRRRLYFLGRRDTEKLLGVVSYYGLSGFEGVHVVLEQLPYALELCPVNHTNAVALRDALSFTAPTVLGLRKSVGLGDRLGLATPGHVRAVRRHSLAPIFAQQSIREMARTGRTPEEVLDDATWGVFQAGWRDGFGADADHLKTVYDIDRCVAAGFTFFTVDPGDHVDDAADTDSPAILEAKVASLPWLVLNGSPADLRDLYLGRQFHVGDFSLTFDEESLLQAAAKYGRAIAHTAVMYRHLAERMGARPFEFEMSVDETETPTSVLEHFFVASELRRLGVEWVSLAPRFVGRFEKGVDYIGDLAEFETSFAQHVAVMRHLGPYKLSLHSGSDKFSIYPIFAKYAGDLVHVKTAGTSYLEALRAIAGIDPPLFRDILAFALARYDEDRATYHVSADASRVPRPDQLTDDELASVLDQFDGRQVLHVTFGSVLTSTGEAGGYRFRDRLLEALESDEEAYYAALEAHFERHLAPFDGQIAG